MSEWVSACKICVNRGEIEKAYQQGRADGKAEGRAEAIKDLQTLLTIHTRYYKSADDNEFVCAMINHAIECYKEQIKEQKNE